MPKFTQGKWEISDDGCIEIYDEKGLLVTGIAEVADNNTTEGQANARLIASAPEMYKWIKYFLRHAGITANNGVADECRLHGDIREAVALIARIDGEECHDKTNLDC